MSNRNSDLPINANVIKVHPLEQVQIYHPKCHSPSFEINVLFSVQLLQLPGCNKIHKLTNQERDDAICFLSYVTKGSHITSVYFHNDYRSLSRYDTQLNNHYTLYMNSLKDHQPRIDFFNQKILCSYKIGYLCLKQNPQQHLYCLRSRRGIAETVYVWKSTMRLKLKTLWGHIIKLSRMA